MKWNAVVLISLCLAVVGGCKTTSTGSRAVSPDDLSRWTFLGLGSVKSSGENLRLTEEKKSKGVMLISPDSYPADVVLRYEVMALTTDTVLVVMMSFANTGDPNALSVPAGYDGGSDWIMNGSKNYFYAFCNGAHQVTPFIRKHPTASANSNKLSVNPENKMVPGIWYAIEIGQQGGRVWLKINGETICEAVDPEPLGGGYLALRIRGTATGPADALFRNLTIQTPPQPHKIQAGCGL
jgi:hypothetical protein